MEGTLEMRPGEISQPVSVALSNAEDLPPGSMAGQYRIQHRMGAGGGGIVYAAEHRFLKRRAAVKVLRREMANMPSMVARFLREATTVNMIHHANIVDIFEFGELPDGRPFYVMELLEGIDLRKLLDLHGRFSGEEVLSIFKPVCNALTAAHGAGIVHRDLKASNIMVIDAGGERIVKLLDFGIAKLLHPEPNSAGLTEAGSVLGTSHNMAPEQLRGEPVDGRADVYALGVLLYQLLTGQYPFRSDHLHEIAWMHMTAPVPRPSQSAPVSPAIDAVVLKAMEKQRDQRYQSAAALLEGLREALSPAVDASPTGSPVAATGIYVEVRTQEGVGDEVDEAMVEDMAQIIDMAESALLEAKFLLPVHTCNALLAIRQSDGTADEEGEVVELAKRLSAEVAARPGADARIHVNFAVRYDSALFRGSTSGPEAVGGELMAIEQWAPDTNIAELAISRAAGR